MRPDTYIHAVWTLWMQTPWAMPTVTPARALRQLWEARGAGNATYAKAGRGGSSDSRGRGDGIIALPAMRVTPVISRRLL